MEQSIKLLLNAGLTENEAKVYFCLLRKNNFTATEISQCAKVNRSKIYSVLDGLISKGLCVEKLGKVRRFEAVNPEKAFDQIIEQQKDRLELLETIPQMLTPVYKVQIKRSSPLDFIQVYSTPATIIDKYDKLELQSQKFVYSFCKKPYAMLDSAEINDAQLMSMSRGVVYKSIFEIEDEKIEWFLYRMLSYISQGEEIRLSAHLPIKLHIFDEEIVMVSMINQINPEENLTYLVIEHGDMTRTLITTFEVYWENSLTVDQYLQNNNLDKDEIIRKFSRHFSPRISQNK
ncbi:MAG: helix-turn-helix domain-containing protein [Candidatus Cloacimonetes bacterium]|nr:helix-turn-helix domain-containing protein [Candidatus Cloacimonadota bacterium]